MSQWIPVSERLPDGDDEVLVYDPVREAVETAEYLAEHRSWLASAWEYDGRSYIFPTHWMPLPEPPKVT